MALAYSNGKSANSSGATTPLVVAAFTPAVVAGQLIVVTIADDSGVGNNIIAVTDTGGNTYTRIATSSGQGSSCLNVYYTVVVIGGLAGTFQVSVAWNTANTTGISVAAGYYNGFVSTPILDQSAVAGPTTSTAASSGATGTTAQANELIIGSVEHAGTTSAFTLGSGFTNIISPSGVAGHQVAQESMVVSSTGAQTATFTISASREWVCGVSTFYDSVGSPSSSVSPSASRSPSSSISASISPSASTSPSASRSPSSSVSPSISPSSSASSSISPSASVSPSASRSPSSSSSASVSPSSSTSASISPSASTSPSSSTSSSQSPSSSISPSVSPSSSASASTSPSASFSASISPSASTSPSSSSSASTSPSASNSPSVSASVSPSSSTSASMSPSASTSLSASPSSSVSASASPSPAPPPETTTVDQPLVSGVRIDTDASPVTLSEPGVSATIDTDGARSTL